MFKFRFPLFLDVTDLPQRHLRRPAVLSGLAILLSLIFCVDNALAYGNAESYGYQFSTSNDKVNQAVVKDTIQKHNSGYYAAPIYTTNIARQFNCNVTASSTGNQGTNSTMANSPSTNGANSNAAGSTSASSIEGTGTNTSASTQANYGAVGSRINGSTSSSLHGTATQALNSKQSNGGDQTASVGTSSACMFGAIN